MVSVSLVWDLLCYPTLCNVCSVWTVVLGVFLATFPTTIFFFIIIFFQVRITSAPMNAFIFECQALVCMINLNPHSYIDSAYTQHNMAVTLLTSYGIWNLDFFRYVIPQFCVSSQLTTIQAISLEYIVAFYPLFLLIVLYTCIQLYARDCKILVHLMRPFQQCRKSGWHPEESLIHSFAAFLVLSYSKIFLVSCRLLHPNVLYSSSGSRVGPLVSFYDPSETYFSSQHLPFATLAIFVIFAFILLPFLVLLLYPTRAFHCCLSYFRLRGHALRAFVDTFQGYYKDGTTGTRDCRCFSALYLLIRIVTVSSHLLPGNYSAVIRIVSYIITSLLFALVRPYKENRINVLDSVVFAIFIFGEVIVVNDEQVGTTKSQPFIPCLLGIFPLAYISLYVTYKLLFRVGLLQRCSLFRNQKPCADATNSLYAHGHHDDHSSTTDFPDRVLHPEQYDPLLSCGNCTAAENCSDGTLLLKTGTLPQCGNSVSDYGSV